MHEWVRLYCHHTVKPVFKWHLNIPENVSLQDRCPFVTGSLTWGRYDTVLRKCPLITERPLIAVSLEDGFYCIIKCIGHSIHTDRGLQKKQNTTAIKVSVSFLGWYPPPPMHYHPQSSRFFFLLNVLRPLFCALTLGYTGSMRMMRSMMRLAWKKSQKTLDTSKRLHRNKNRSTGSVEQRT